MIVVDTSVLVAVLRDEPDADYWIQRLTKTRVTIGAPTKFELLLVMARSDGLEGVNDARELLTTIGCHVADWTDALADTSVDAFLIYGKGMGHPAQLNFGDCMAYALAKALDAPLLYKGDDFARTDIASAIAITP